RDATLERRGATVIVQAYRAFAPLALIALVADREVEDRAAVIDGVAHQVMEMRGPRPEARGLAVGVARQHMIIRAPEKRPEVESGGLTGNREMADVRETARPARTAGDVHVEVAISRLGKDI